MRKRRTTKKPVIVFVDLTKLGRKILRADLKSQWADPDLNIGTTLTKVQILGDWCRMRVHHGTMRSPRA